MIKYLAGIFDAEGYIRIRRTTSKSKVFFTPEVRIYMTNWDIINEFSKLYNIPIKTSIRGNNRKIAYSVSFGVKKLRQCSFIDDFLPYLNEKRNQLSIVNDFLNSDLKDKESHYKYYMFSKTDFTAPVNTPVSFEYMAGIIDGDGWISMFNSGKGKGLYNKYSIGIEQRYKPLIEYFSKNFGNKNGKIYKNKIYSNNHLQTWSSQKTTFDILPLLKGIEPFLIEKKEKCNKLILYIEKLEQFRKESKEVLENW